LHGCWRKIFSTDLDSEKGKFRAFLLASLKHFLANEWDKAEAQKRGGSAAHLSLDWQTAERSFRSPPRTSRAWTRAFDRDGRWPCSQSDLSVCK